MKSSLEWNIIAGRITKDTLGTQLMRILHQYALAFAEQAEEIEKLQKHVEELEHRLNSQQ